MQTHLQPAALLALAWPLLHPAALLALASRIHVHLISDGFHVHLKSNSIHVHLIIVLSSHVIHQRFVRHASHFISDL